jgi:hypothetical protein
MIKSFQIDGFRGIRNLSVEQLNRVNLIVGDNNSGKTSVLESLQLLRNPSQVSNLYRVARLRESLYFIRFTPLYENVLCLFPHTEKQLALGVSAQFDDRPVGCFISGEQTRILIDATEMDGMYLRRAEMVGESEADQFQGMIEYVNGAQKGETPFQINTYSKSSGAPIAERDTIKMEYVSPCDHLRGDIVSRIIRSEGYKEVCIRALQLFDEEIEDILVLKSPVSTRSVDYIKHRSLGIMPIATFGDGIKKVLVLANAIAKAKNGVLFIDEVETSIHKKYYDEIFRFIVKACSAFNIQAFITTHSIEAVDGLLATQDYQEQAVTDDISVITIKRANGQTYSRVLPGREVAAEREAFEFEVRL